MPGDVISLAAGDKVPADARLLKVSSSAFKVDQVWLIFLFHISLKLFCFFLDLHRIGCVFIVQKVDVKCAD